MRDPGSNGLPSRLGNLDLDGSLRLLLQHDRPCSHGLAVAYIADLQLNEVTGSKLAVDGQIEQGLVRAAEWRVAAEHEWPISL